MRILVFGAGVLGSLYAARLKQSGQDVTILARGQRLTDICEHGIVLEHALSGRREIVQMPAVDKLGDHDAYDLIIVLVRKDQADSVLPVIGAHHNTPNILFMVNNPSGYAEWVKAVGKSRLLLGFAGAGGTRVGNVVRYIVVSRFLQATTVGELDGAATDRLAAIVRMFTEAGFPTVRTTNMEAWQKTHVAWVSPLANAIYMMDGDNRRLAGSPNAVRLVVQAVREGMQVLHALGVPVTPRKLRVWEQAPEPLLIAALRTWIGTEHFRTVAVEHTMAAVDEMRLLADEFQTIAASTGINTPAVDELRRHISKPGS